MRTYEIRNWEQLTRGCSLRGLDGWLTTPHREETVGYEMFHRASDLKALVNTVVNLLVP
jgi:hypothetical protein